MDVTTVTSPGGTATMQSATISRKVYIGLAATALGAILLYGTFQGREASLYAEVDLDPVTRSGAQIGEWAWPRSDSGVILADDLSYAFFDSVPAPASRLIIGVGATGSTGATIATKVAELTPVADTWQTLRGSGSVKLPNRIIVGPGKYLTFSWYNGSGATVSGDASGIARIKVEPCGTKTFTCD